MRRAAAAAVAGLVVFAALPAGAALADAIRDGQWYLTALHVRQAWQATRGAGVTACVIDSGIDGTVPDLRGAVAGRKQFTGYVDGNGLVTSHGTGVASVLAGRGHGPGHADGVIGVAPRARLLDAVIGDADPDFPQQAADAVRWCTDSGAGVINMSFGVLGAGPLDAAVAYAESKDVVVVAASTNTFEHLGTSSLPDPAGLPGVLAVTGIDKDLQHDDGAFTSSIGKRVSLAAPFSTTPGANGYPDIGLPVAGVPARDGTPYPGHAAGTSYSAPIVAGAAVLIRAAHPSMTANDVIAALLATATPAGSGHPNRTYGWGIVNVAAAVAVKLPSSRRNPLVTGVVPRPLPTSTPTAARTSPARSSGPMTVAPMSTAAPSRGDSGTATARAHSSAGSSHLVWLSVLAAVLVVGAAAVLVRRRSGSDR